MWMCLAAVTVQLCHTGTATAMGCGKNDQANGTTPNTRIQSCWKPVLSTTPMAELYCLSPVRVQINCTCTQQRTCIQRASTPPSPAC